MSIRRNHQHGFTLIEALIVMGLLAGFLTILATMFTTIVDLQVQSSSYSAVASDGRYIMARLDYDIARASAIGTPGSLGSTAPSLALTINGTSYTYALSGNNLQLADGTGSDNLNGSRTTVSNVSFLLLGNASGKESIRYTFTVSSTVTHPGSNDNQTFTSTVERR